MAMEVTRSVATDDRQNSMPDGQDDWSTFRVNALRFCAVFVVVWLSFYAFYVRFPYIRNGADIIYSTKMDYIGSHGRLRSTKPLSDRRLWR